LGASTNFPLINRLWYEMLCVQAEKNKEAMNKMKLAATALPNELLRNEREQRNWTQEYVAERIGAPDPKMVGKWERGNTTPQLHYCKQLAKLFEKSTRELGLVRRGEVPFWNVPYRQNPFFTGREDILMSLHEALRSDKAAALTQPYALCGLGGVGKTQTAVEYAFRYRHKYQAILWVRADSREVLTSDFAAIAALLHMPEQNEQVLSRTMAAVKQWLTAVTRWLLIFDNVDDLQIINDFMPSPCRGHALLTTRTNITGTIAHSIEIDTMQAEEGAFFLLRRAKIIALDASQDNATGIDYYQAGTISQALGGLPLALDQAGAYIEETQCSLLDYLNLYQTRRELLLKWRGDLALDHPEPVATTWSISFEKIHQASPVATELLNICAFLAPDAIPEEIISIGAPDLGPFLQHVASDPYKLNVVIKELLKFSLIRRNPNSKTLTIHRLVQAVLKDRMDENTQRQYAERVVLAVNCVFPDAEFSTWSLCQRYLAQAQVCAVLIKQWGMKFAEASRLLHRVGQYLYQRARYAEAELLYQQALEIREQVLGSEHPEVATILSNLASLYWDQSKYTLAEPLFLRALSIHEQALGLDHPDVATSLNALALLYKAQDRNAQAKPFFLRALSIRERVQGPEHLDVATTLNNLAMVYCNEDKYTQAEPLFIRALSIRERVLGPEHPDVATSLNYLAGLYVARCQHTQAEPLFTRALSIRERVLGPEHPDVATSLNNLAMLYSDQGRYSEAEPLYLRALAIKEQVLGPKHPEVATALNNLARHYYSQNKYAQAEPLYLRALAICEQALGPQHPVVALVSDNYASLLWETDREDEALELEARARAIWDKRARQVQASPSRSFLFHISPVRKEPG
jgi:tetratricopeptide (TPR) repeat protein/DNA-binding XRE family transcriptional regulator